MKLRRSMLFVPGNNPAIIKDVHIYKPDSVMFDLEDAIAVTEKDSARFLVFNMLQKFKDLYKREGIETVVRINSLDSEYGIQDLEFMVRSGVEVIRIPKTDTAKDVHDVEEHIERIEKEAGIPVGTTKIMVAIESPLGALNALEIARSSSRLIGMAIGGEDYVTNLKTTRSTSGVEMLMARSMIVMAARASGISAMDSVYSDVNNDEGFLNEANTIKQMGFDGKSLIHPRQIELIHQVYTPDEKNIKKSLKIIAATEEAMAEGKGVFTVDGKMVDKPIIERAYHVLNLAKAAGISLEGLN
ncbi:HpcH/HpaI aldolase/citrate lyase family protein [Cetobacterium sp. 2A]|uniref:aldolase/citrate lyase family protein n=1 Tax=unclassified Cetobacterium TaxID=2630983 RepID=UPI00163CEE85|nr:aldolase/citrate lyase family protein [Cetobacterium sp. 2A]MBC2857371.1 HpcH/HpaI aldolase/citrate lyase family protein [Cetobacterium sp. 2A]